MSEDRKEDGLSKEERNAMAAAEAAAALEAGANGNNEGDKADAGHDAVAEQGSDMPDVAALEAERDELRDKLLRALAEIENLRKRAERERREAMQYGGSRLARDILSVYDNLTRALSLVTEEQRKAAEAFIEGIELTRRELLSTLERHNIVLISPEKGEDFNPDHHEAMFEAPVPGTEQGKVIEVMREGFRIGDRLLRPAQVGVSARAPAASEAATERNES